jgi:ribosomal protein S14
MRRRDTLDPHLATLAMRGFVPTVDLGWNWTNAGAVALANSLQDNGLPVYLLIPEADLIQKHAWADNDVWVTGPDAAQGGKMRRWPCLPNADPTRGAAYVARLLRLFERAGVEVDGVWFDDEKLPHPFNGVYAAQRSSDACRAAYPPGVIDSEDAFRRYALQLRADLSSAIMADPVKTGYPDAVVGNYGDYAYDAGSAELHGYRPVTPRGIGRMDAQMPSVYALPFQERRRLDPLERITPLDADQVHFYRSLAIISRSAAHKPKDSLLIPFMNRVHHDGTHGRDAGRYLGMSRSAFREAMRHGMLRGVDSYYLFNLGHDPDYVITPAESFSMLDDARLVYDEMLAQRAFLTRGEPMTFDVPRAPDRFADWPTKRPEMTVWSGLRLDDRCLVRVTSMEDRPRSVTVEPWPGVRFDLESDREGRTVILHRNGQVTEVPTP